MARLNSGVKQLDKILPVSLQIPVCKLLVHSKQKLHRKHLSLEYNATLSSFVVEMLNSAISC